ncbi:unnamed protein product, partial [Rotaria sp. Silwood1]
MFLLGTESSWLFSHHEKIVVIDQRIAFIGGIDLCWGRWDTDEHRLVDLCDENITELILPNEKYDQLEKEVQKEEAAVSIIEKMAESTRVSNIASSTQIPKELCKQSKLDQEKKSLLKSNQNQNVNGERTKNNSNLAASPVTDFRSVLTDAEREILADEENTEHGRHKHKERWKRIIKTIRKKEYEESSNENEEILSESIDEKPKTIINEISVSNKKIRYFIGKDYANAYDEDFKNLEKFEEDCVDRKIFPRMPWHDEALVVSGEAARDCARHFIQRWNIHKADQYRFNEFFPYILPKSYDDDQLFDSSMLSDILGEKLKPIRFDAQCVRSAADWSCSIGPKETSIQNAYIHMIKSAQHFIYIENQFFVSIANDTTIKNLIDDALYHRIIDAANKKEKFRVYVVLPLLPGFSNENAVQAVLYCIMRSINKGETSLYQRLIRDGVSNPEEYITFYGMRNWDILMDTLITEIIYVHSKLMIVDDRMCICGSANINDRSLQGSRDSEFCLAVEDDEMIDSQLNGQKQKVGLFSSTWRKKLFRQLLGIKNEEEMSVDDPCSDEFYEYFRRRAKANAQIYEEVFNTLPTNRVRTFIEVTEYTQKSKLRDTDPLAAHKKCKQIKGFVVEFPLEYVADDVLIPKWTTKEGQSTPVLDYYCNENDHNIQFSWSSSGHSGWEPTLNCSLQQCNINLNNNATCRSSSTLCFDYRSVNNMIYCAPGLLCSLLEPCNNVTYNCTSNTSVCIINSCCSPKAILVLGWINVGNMNYERVYHTASVLTNGKVLVTGGTGTDANSVTALNTCQLYDPLTGTWAMTGNMNHGRYDHTASVLTNGKVLVTGGTGNDYASISELYDPSTGAWTITGSMIYARHGHTASLLENGK